MKEVYLVTKTELNLYVRVYYFLKYVTSNS